ncbi:MAG: ABC transporter substrate-binding protein [Elusimicrobia bacterium]|nr:ABC transporter substrate-binding protein [Elusimicrobiota bacterium]
MKTVIRAFSLSGAFAIAALGISAPAQAQAKKKVAIISFNDSEPRYITTRKEAEKEAKASGAAVEFTVYDMKGKKDTAGDVIKKAMADKTDIYMALGTSAAVPVAKEIKDKPIVIGMVYDPIELKIAKDWESSGNNVTGASNFVSIPNFVRRLVKRSAGTVTIKKVTVLYTPGEKNSELQLAGAQSVEKELGLTLTPIAVTNKEDVEKWSKNAAGSADLMMVTGSNPIGTNIATIVDACIKAKIPTATHLEDLVERGILYGLVADAEEVGKLAGEALVKVAKDNAAPSSVPIKFPLSKLIINEKTKEAGGFTIPPMIAQWAKKRD